MSALGEARQERIRGFFAYAQERYAIYLRRGAGQPKPWTADPVLLKYRFCNVFREDDRTTGWFRAHLREPLRDDPHVLFATAAFRWFNRIETGELLLDLLRYPGAWNPAVAYGRLRHRAEFLKLPVVTGSYVVRGANGKPKYAAMLDCVEGFRNVVDVEALEGMETLQAMHAYLKGVPYLGGFTAYEIVTDLRWTYLGEQATDIMTWANLGPGATGGLGMIWHGDPGHYREHSRAHQAEMLGLCAELLFCSQLGRDDYWPGVLPPWEMRDVEHTLCEYLKYTRAQKGGRVKMTYQGGK